METGGTATAWSWSGPNSFTSSLQNPTINAATTAADGNYFVTVTNANNCTATSSIAATVNAAPSPLATSDSPICVGENLNLMETGTGATGWSWSGPNSFTSSLQNPTITSATAAASGDYFVTVTNSDNCTATSSIAATVNTNPTAVATSNSAICAGEDLNLMETGGTATAWSWSGPNSFTSSLQNPTINAATTAADGNYFVTVTNANNCTATSSIAATVNAAPSPLATSDSPICVGEDLNLMETGTGATGWSWSGPNSFTSSLQNPTITSATAAADGDYFVTVTNSDNCTATSSIAATVNTNPTAVATSNSAICAGEDLNLMETGGTATAWSWSGPNSFTSSLQNPTINAATTAAGGNYFVTVTNANNCTATSSIAATVNAAPSPLATSDSPICVGENLNLMETGTGATGWSWSGPNSFTSSLQNPTITSATAAAGGDYFVTVTNSDNCTATSSIAATVNTNPTAVATSNSAICAGEDLNLMETGGTATAWSWSGPNSFTSSLQNPTIIAATTAADGNYFVTVTNTAGCTGTSSIAATVHPAAVGMATSNSAICAGEDLNLMETGGTATAWSWSGPNSFTSSLQNPSVIAATTAADGNYFVTVTNTAGCTGTSSIAATVHPAAVGMATSNSAICAGEDLNLMETGGTATAWSWSGPNSFTSSLQNPSVIAATTAADGNYFVTVTNTAGCTGTSSIAATVHPAAVGMATSNSTICAGEDLNLMETGGTATAWSWSGPNSFTSSLQNPSVIAATTAADGNYFVTVTNTAGCTGTSSIAATVHPAAVGMATSNSAICAGEDLNLMETGGTATAWSWSGPNSFTSSLQNPSVIAATTAADGNYFVTVTNTAGCTGTSSIAATVHPAAVGMATSNSAICAGEDLNLMETGGTATAWSWSGPNSFTSSLQNPSVIAATTAADGNYFVTVTNTAGCTGTSSIAATVHPAAVGMATSNSAICAGEDLNLMETGGTATAWSWSGPNSFTSSLQNPSVIAATTAADGNYFVTVTNTAGCTGTSSIAATVHPAAVGMATSNSAICAGEDLNLMETGGTATAWSWSGPNSFTSSLQNPSVIAATTAADGNYFVTVTNTAGCTGTSSIAATVHPAAVGMATSNSAICAGEDLNLMETGGTATAWSWSGPNSFTSSLQNPSVIAATTAADGNYFVTVTNTAGCTGTSSIAATVHPAAVGMATSNSAICAGEDLNLMETGGTATAWSWSGPNSFTSSLQNPSVIAATTAADGNYFVTVTNTAGCTGTSSIAATVHATPTVNASNNTPICAGEDLNLMETGTGATTWSWIGPNSFTSSLQNPSVIAATTAADGDYFVTVTNTEGCTSTGSTSATVHPTPVPNITGTFSFCLGRQAILDAGTYNDVPNTYLWSNTATTQLISTTVTGVYTVTVTNNSACTGTASAAVSSIPCLAAVGTMTTNVNSICSGDDVIISTTGANQAVNYTQQYFAYAQDNLGNTTFVASNATGIFSGLAAGDYLVCAYNECTDCSPTPSPLTTTLNDINDTGTIQDGCYDIECQSITVPEALNPIAGTGQTDENNSTGNNIFLADVCGGTPPYNIDFTFSQGFASVQEIPSDESGCAVFQIVYTDPAEWTLVITDSNGCSSGTVIFTSDGLPTSPLPQIEGVDMSPETCPGDADGSLTIDVEGGDDSCGTYNYAVSSVNGFSETGTFPMASGTGTFIVDDLASGTYSITVTDCSGTTTVADANVSRLHSGGRSGRGRGACKTVVEDILSEMKVFPNPFNHTTTIAYSLLEDAHVELVIYTIDGRLIEQLFEGEIEAGDLQRMDFDASDLSTGMYVLQLRTDSGIVHHEQLSLVK